MGSRKSINPSLFLPRSPSQARRAVKVSRTALFTHNTDFNSSKAPLTLSHGAREEREQRQRQDSSNPHSAFGRFFLRTAALTGALQQTQALFFPPLLAAGRMRPLFSACNRAQGLPETRSGAICLAAGRQEQQGAESLRIVMNVRTAAGVGCWCVVSCVFVVYFLTRILDFEVLKIKQLDLCVGGTGIIFSAKHFAV